MTTTNGKKPWWASKTIWAVVITLAVTIMQSQGVEFPEWVIPSLISAGLLLNRASTKQIK